MVLSNHLKGNGILEKKKSLEKTMCMVSSAEQSGLVDVSSQEESLAEGRSLGAPFLNSTW